MSFLSNISSWFWKQTPPPTMVDKPVEVAVNAIQPADVPNPQKVTPDSGRGTAAVPNDEIYDEPPLEPCPVGESVVSHEDVVTSTPGSVKPVRFDECPAFVDIPHGAPSLQRREREPTKYDGKSDWTDFLGHFTAVSKWNHWSYHEMGLQLAICLTGEAREVLAGLAGAQKHDYNSLVDAMNRRYSPEGRESMFSLQLMNRVCRDKEDITAYGHAIRRLATKAYPNQALEEKILVDMFIKGLPNPEMKRHVYLAKTQTLSEAINSAVAYDAFDKPETDIEQKAKKPKATVAAVQAKGKDVDGQPCEDGSLKTQFTEALTQMTQAIGELKQQAAENQRKNKKDLSKVECYNCHEKGHYSKYCPKKDPLRASNSSGTKGAQSN